MSSHYTLRMPHVRVEDGSLVVIPVHRQVAGASESSRIRNAVSLARRVRTVPFIGIDQLAWARYIERTYGSNVRSEDSL